MKTKMKHIQTKTLKQIIYTNIVFSFIVAFVMFISFNVYEVFYNEHNNIQMIEKKWMEYDLKIGCYVFDLHNGYVGIFDKKHNIIHYKPLKITNFYITYLFITFLINISWMIKIYEIVAKSEEEKYLLKVTNLESMATQNSMSVLTENIHHELNSPLNVIKLKFKKITEELSNNKKMKNNIDLINMSLDQISTILVNMSDFKSLKYSNGNKTLYEIIEGAFRMIKVVSDNEFEYFIDEDFKKYHIDHSYGLKNADVISIFINFIKNSLEANATNICINIENKKGNYLLINIKDNGNGIPNDMINKIFEPNKSSKDNDTIGLRGNGLFLVQNLLKMFGGDAKLKKSKRGNGTEFVIKIPIIENSSYSKQ